MKDITYPLYPIVAFIGFVLVLIPLPWHFQAWNSGTCYFILWTSVACLNQFINSVVWASNAVDKAPWLCEISTRLTLGASVGIPAACLCISRRLFKIARVQAVLVTPAEKRKAVIIDSLLCVLFPVVYVVVSYVVQGHRYDIFEQVGCFPAIFNTVPAYFLVYMWPMVISLTSAVFNVLSIRAFLIRQAQFRRFLNTSGTLTSSRYFRLMALALTDIIFTLPLSMYEVISDTANGAVAPWRGWDDAHFGFNRVNQYPAPIWRADPTRAVPLELTRWITPMCALVFFAYFGFAEEARKNYSNVLKAIRDRLYHLRISPNGFTPRRAALPFSSKKMPLDDTLPVYTPPSPSTATYVGSEKSKHEQDEKSEFKSFRTLSIPQFVPLDIPVSPSVDEYPTTPSTLHYPFTPSTGQFSLTPESARFPTTPSSSTSLTNHELYDPQHSQEFYHAV